MSSCNHDCEHCGSHCGDAKPQDLRAPANGFSHVKHVIAVVSGKGGVGKSLVTGLMASAMQHRGHQVAVLDADITGPSIPRLLGGARRADACENGILPVENPQGIRMISINNLLERDVDPVIWRGSLIAGTVTQFWSDVVWGDVDYMFVDMPPGTGDVPLTVFQSLPVDGIIIVTSPQELVSMIVQKAIRMAAMMDIPVLGLVENMSYFPCPDCGKKLYPFGEGRTPQVAEEYGIPLLARLPIDPDLASACDQGLLGQVQLPELEEACKICETIGE